MNRLFLFALVLVAFCACQETMEDKAERDAKEFTRRYCPTPVINGSRTDSVAFSKTRRVYTYYISFVDYLDNQELIDAHKDEIQQMLRNSLKESTGMKQYFEAGFKFEYVCRSAKNPKVVYLQSVVN